MGKLTMRFEGESRNHSALTISEPTTTLQQPSQTLWDNTPKTSIMFLLVCYSFLGY